MIKRTSSVISLLGFAALVAVTALGCRGHQYAHVLQPDQQDMVGSHTAGAETYKPLIDAAVAQLLGRHDMGMRSVGFDGQSPQPMRICFVGVENKSAEEIGDFKDQIYQHIDTQIVASERFRPISKRFVDAALQETRLRPDQLILPDHMRTFTAELERQGQPFDYLLYATLTSGTTRSNEKSYQRDYLLTLEMVNIKTGDYDKESAMLRKGYHKTRVGKAIHYNPFKQ